MTPSPTFPPDPDAVLQRLVDEERADDGSRRRVRRRWLRQQAEEEAEFSGTLLALLERGAGVDVSTATGRRHRGRIVGLGRDVCALRTLDGRRSGCASPRSRPSDPSRAWTARPRATSAWSIRTSS